jgi:hypothetical protein
MTTMYSNTGNLKLRYPDEELLHAPDGSPNYWRYDAASEAYCGRSIA